MSDEPLALATVSPLPAALADYDAICATVMESARGRWFLQEYARRNRSADTRLVLAAIERIEALIRSQQSFQDLRNELIDMAKTIAVTRAEIADIVPGSNRKEAATSAASVPDVFAAAERVQEVAWTMRERGLDPATCDQIEALATSILSNAALRDPNDRRARKLGEVLHYLGRRIEGMLDDGAPAAPPQADPPNDSGVVDVANGHGAATPAPVRETAEPTRASPARSLPPVSAAPVASRETIIALQGDAIPSRLAAVETELQVDDAREGTTTAAVVAHPPSPANSAIACATEECARQQRIVGSNPTAESATSPAAAAYPAESPLETTAFDMTAEIDEDLFAESPAETAGQRDQAQAPAAAVAVSAEPVQRYPADGPAGHAIAIVSAAALPVPTVDASANDLIAALKAMSDDERIALFT
jgi:hypothetical protein